MENPDIDRLGKLEELLKRKKRNGNQICWVRYNSDAQMNYEILDAEEDILWMLYEIKRLREENKQLQEFTASMRDQLQKELDRFSPDNN